jgi:hypothetical protein
MDGIEKLDEGALLPLLAKRGEGWGEESVF